MGMLNQGKSARKDCYISETVDMKDGCCGVRETVSIRSAPGGSEWNDGGAERVGSERTASCNRVSGSAGLGVQGNELLAELTA